MKKILIVTPYFYPHSGGLENYIYNIAKGINKKSQYSVVVITSNHQDRKYLEETLEDIKIYRLPILFKISNTPINPLWYFQIRKILKYERPDLVNAHSPVPFIADIAALVTKNIPFVLTYHCGTMKKDEFLFDKIIVIYEKIFLRQMLRRANRIICASEFVKKTIIKNYSTKATVITPAVDTEIFKPINKKNNITNSVLFIGRHANVYKLKGLYYLIDAMKEFPNLKLRVVGEKIKLKEKNIKFVGVKKGKKLVEELQNTSILVLSSLAHMESFGMVLIEAMACKTPVVGTRIGGIPEVISNGKDGILVPSKNTKALVEAIKTIIENPTLAKKMGENGYKKVKNNFLWYKKVEQTQHVLQNLI